MGSSGGGKKKQWGTWVIFFSFFFLCGYKVTLWSGRQKEKGGGGVFPSAPFAPPAGKKSIGVTIPYEGFLLFVSKYLLALD